MRDGNAKKGHKAVLVLLALFCAWAVVPVFGAGIYRNASGQVFFDLWYLIGFMVLGFLLMHELITPLPPKDVTKQAAPGRKSGRAGSGGASYMTLEHGGR